uniref:Uncharacterized protein n=1 Tax=Timema cristinae TaxID=61476 RepID=A0A7R9DHC8_TIMCR|nr:unnamed protein product [Timema cristinae]
MKTLASLKASPTRIEAKQMFTSGALTASEFKDYPPPHPRANRRLTGTIPLTMMSARPPRHHQDTPPTTFLLTALKHDACIRDDEMSPPLGTANFLLPHPQRHTLGGVPAHIRAVVSELGARRVHNLIHNLYIDIKLAGTYAPLIRREFPKALTQRFNYLFHKSLFHDPNK